MIDRILLDHGGGGRLSHRLIREEILPRFACAALNGLPDAATLDPGGLRMLFSTDSFVVQPLFFPGGCIGDLAVFGTVNDLAVAGSRPRWLSLGMILEEGLPLAILRRVLDAVQLAASRCDLQVVTGDTKVVRRGQCDGMYLNTAGIGQALPGFALGPERLRPGDRVLVSGPLGDHGLAVLAAREGLGLANGPVSDTRPLHRLVLALGELAPGVRFMRDPTRGGLAAVLNEMVEERAVGVMIEERRLPFSPATRALAELTGLDLLHVASEGCLVLVCAPELAPAILERWRPLPEGAQACVIGQVAEDASLVVLETAIGGRRVVDAPQGELLPRIC
ncbi:MAG: hydrogenase expression/formation protein HypE [Magnetococcales bacterium]|nr:hydrogenase expression/formation protein HypE [Magnetococcales bacterium]